MRLTFPHMGNLWIILETLFRDFTTELVIPPPNSRRTLSLGVKYSPEWVCLPFKMTLGNMIEALDMGADTIVMPAGRGLCRFGYYAKLQEKILKDMGYKFQMVTTDLFGKKIWGVAQLLRFISGGAPMGKIIGALKFALGAKMSAMDELERLLHKVRAREKRKGDGTRIFREALMAIREADTYEELERKKREYKEKLLSVPMGDEEPLIIGVVGEFYVVLEPFVNMDVEAELGKLGVEVRRSLFLSEWTKFSLLLNAIGMSEKEKLHKAAKPYLKRDVGGDGWETVGEKVLHKGEYDGLVHLLPFTCMPEIVALNIMPSIKNDMPVLSIICDEQMGRAGMVTRLEAFVDLIKMKRGRRDGGIHRDRHRFCHDETCSYR